MIRVRQQTPFWSGPGPAGPGRAEKVVRSKWDNPENPILKESLVKISENHEFSDFVGSPPCEPGSLPTTRAGQPAAAALVLGG